MILSALLEERATTSITQPAGWLFDALGLGPGAAGKTITEATAMRITAVNACVRILSNTLAQLPLVLYRNTANGKERAIKHPLYKVLAKKWNPEMSSFIARQVGQGHVVGWGNAFYLIERNRRGDVMNLWPLLPDRTRPKRIQGEIFYETDFNGQTTKIPAEDVLHIKGLGFDGLIGYSMIRMNADQLGTALATQEYSGRFFGQGGNLSGVLEHPGKVEDKEQLRKDWDRIYSGVINAMRTAVLEKGLTYRRIGIPPNDAQFIETRKMQRADIASMFGVPLHFLGDPNTKYANREAEGLDFVTYAIGAWMVNWEQEMELKLLRPAERVTYFLKHNADALLRGDLKTRTESYVKMTNVGAISRNEIRELEDRNTISEEDLEQLGGLDVPLLPLNLAPANAEPAPPPEPAPDEEDADDEEQGRQVMLGVAERELRRLTQFVRKAQERADSPADLLERLHTFLGSWRTTLADVLIVPAGLPQFFCDRLWRDVGAAEVVEDVLRRWENMTPEELLEGLEL